MGFGLKVLVEGEYALFSRPELKVERFSYDIITPSAAQGILEAVLWKPAIRYVIDKIHVLNPICFTNIRRNEVSAKASASLALTALNGGTKPLYIATADNIQQRASLVLRDVSYVIEAHFELTDRAGARDTPEKFYNMILRRLRGGQCFHQPYLGTREFPARLRLVEEGETFSPLAEDRDFGLMLHHIDYSDPEDYQPAFFHAVMRQGTIDLTDCEVMR